MDDINIALKQPEKIYDYIADIIKSFEDKLCSPSGDEQVDNAKKQTLEIIQEFKHIEIEKALTELKKNQEWDTFTIAFYGETNAGKSTIIETLRIYFQEKTKIDVNRKFQEIYVEYKNKLNYLEEEVRKSEYKSDECNKKSAVTLSDFEILKVRIEEQIFSKNELENKKIVQSVWYKVISYLNLSPLKKEMKELKFKLKNINSIHQQELQNIKKILEIEDNKVKDFRNQLDELHESNMQVLSDLSDGQIIGDGRSDFTRHTTEYYFIFNEEKFVFLDIPGIEGKESVVIDEIASAVKKAHAVFYVTSNPVPPQKGGENKQGTLEKIKEHLNAQTEVYTIFNKRITNPMQLEKALINEDEKSSLEILNEKMLATIGENYIGNINLSAKVSFLALAECLEPRSKILDEKNKFLNKFTKDDLIEKALLIDFTNFLTFDLVQNTKSKIKKSNFNKANNVLKQLTSILSLASKDHFQPLYIQLSEDLQDVSKKLHNTLETTKNDMESAVKKIITSNLKVNSRKDIYDYIDTNVSDESFKNTLESVIKEKYKIVINIIPIALAEEFQIFQNKINKVLENFKRRTDAAIKDYANISFKKNDFNLKINIKNGIDEWGLAGSLTGAGALAYSAPALIAMGPPGWAILAIGALTVLVGFVKSIYKFFSDSYKMDEQKKSANENIDKITKEIEKNILKELKLSFIEFEKVTDNIIDDITSSVEQVIKVNSYILDTTKSITRLSKNIQIEGER